MEKAVRNVTVHIISNAKSIAAVLLNRWENLHIEFLFFHYDLATLVHMCRCRKVLVYNISEEEQAAKFECQELQFDCFPLAAAFTQQGDLYILSDDPASPIKHLKLSEDSKYIPESTDLDPFNKNVDNLKIVNGLWILYDLMN